MTVRISFVALPVVAAAALSACAAPIVTVEVLPPRTSVTCDAPTVDDPALGTGLMDAKATDDVHGGYLADLRLVAPGVNARIDGVSIRLTRDGSEIDKIDNVPTGDVFLTGSKDDVRKSVVENVQLMSREIALTLAKDSAITELDFATVVAEISPKVIGTDVTPESSTFALNVCNGCLVTPPPAATCAVVAKLPVCRVGQDVPLFSCAQAAP